MDKLTGENSPPGQEQPADLGTESTAGEQEAGPWGHFF